VSVNDCFAVISSLFYFIFEDFSQTRAFERWERVGRSEDLGIRVNHGSR
jgi:hypothetical protein